MGNSFIARSFSTPISFLRGGDEKIDLHSFRGENEDDEEDLKRAALEKLPSFDRLRKGSLTVDEEGLIKEVDVKSLSLLQERKSLLERLVGVTDEDHERFLLKLKDRMDRVGIEFPTFEVRFEHLNVEGEAYVGSRSLPSFFNSTMNILESITNFLRIRIFPSKKRSFTILHDLSGIIKPGRMTLLLGPPSSGKTSLLLALIGKLDSDLKVSGKVSYNGEELDKFVPQRIAAYISQYDLHLRDMTVRETIMFSAKCQGVGFHYDMLTELLIREKAANIRPDRDIDIFMKATSIKGNDIGLFTDYIIKILGLDICADTLIGDQMIRGISGGQKRRVTIGEMIVGRTQVLFMDEVSNGLDSSTTFKIINRLGKIIHILGGTGLITLLQPTHDTYDLFDDIILLSDGQIVYHGPREDVLDFFSSVGFGCPERKGVADFLQEVTSKKDQKQYWVQHDKSYKYVSVRELAEIFQSFHACKGLRKELSVPFDNTKRNHVFLRTSMYGVNKINLLKACVGRELLLLKRNSIVYAFRAFKMMITSFIMMTIFLRTNMPKKSVDDGSIFLGSLDFLIMNIMFNGFAELSLTIDMLNVLFKQRDSLFYPSWAYALPTLIMKIPFSFIEVSFLVILNYYAIGYDPSIVRFIKQYILLFLINQMASGLYRLIAVIARTMALASAMTIYAFCVFLIFSGFLLSYDDLSKGWIWGYWISPIMYSQISISVNEFLGKSWGQVKPGTNQTLGVIVLNSHGIFAEPKWYWIGVTALLGYVLIFNFLFSVSLSYIKPLGKSQAILSEEILEEKLINTSKTFESTSLKGMISNQLFEPRDEVENSMMYDLNATMLTKRKVMALPFTPLSIAFDNIKYSVDIPQEMRENGIEEKLVLLNGLSGCFIPGVLTAIMGVSGAGKTTLMDVLMGRKTTGCIEGNITISGYPKNQQTFARMTGYCEQNVIHSPHLTIYESLVYSAWLRLPIEVDSMIKNMFVEEVMELIEMMPLRDALVGLSGINGLSIEQRKRLTIAVELVANPSIIFMDEPTSGVDARAAAIIMRTVRNIVNTGRTIVCTIHQPGIDIFEEFDELFLMKRGGEEIYVGPLGKYSCHLITYFEGILGVNKIKDGCNPATWVLEVTSEAQEKLLGTNFNDIYKNSNLFQRNRALIEEQCRPLPGSCKLHFPTKYSQPFLSQCMACLWKQHLSYSRNSSYTTLRFFYTILLAFTSGTIYWNLGRKTGKQQDLFNAMGSMYAVVLFIGVTYSMWVQPIVSVEREVFYRERAAGMYSSLSYAIGQVVIEQPYILVQSLLYSVLVYEMIGFEWTTTKFFWYFFFTYFTSMYFTYYGMMMVSMTPNLQVANVVSGAFYSIWNLFSGFIIPWPKMPILWRWVYWTCPMSWSLYGLLVSQYGDSNDLLDTEQTVADFLKSFFGFRHELLGAVALMVVFFTISFAFFFGFAIKVFKFQIR